MVRVDFVSFELCLLMCHGSFIFFFFFFFKQKTAYEMRISDWSSDVCSSDLAIVDQLRRPLGSLPEADRAFIDALLGETLDKTIIADRIRERFQSRRGTS